MTLRALTAAKVNLGLEVLGRRDDGYHEIRTVLASVSLFDRIRVEPADETQLHVDQAELDTADNLVRHAADLLLTPAAGHARMALRKRIPAAAGLGGASSDAAATLLSLDRLFGLQTDPARLHALAADLGSDVPFFLTGGMALAEGRGEQLTPLPCRTLHLIIVVPAIDIPRKTATLYGALRPADFSDGERITGVRDALLRGALPTREQLANAFLRPLLDMAPRLRNLPEAMELAGCSCPSLSGTGPALYSLERDRDAAAAAAGRLRARLGRQARVFVCRTVPRAVIIEGERLDGLMGPPI